MKTDFKIQDIKSFFFGLSVKGAYVQTAPKKGRLVGLDLRQFIFSVDATSLYPSAMILNNISEETFYGRVYDAAIIDKFMNLLEATLSGQLDADQSINVIYDAFKMQFQMFAKKEKIAKAKETVIFNTDYCTYLFSKIVKSGASLDDIMQPKTDLHYRILKSYLHPILEALTWTSPYNKGYNQTVIEWVFHHDTFHGRIKHAWVIENIYSFKTVLKKYSSEELANSVFVNYILNPWGVLFVKHSSMLATDVQKILDSMSSRKKIKDEMIALGQLLNNILHGNADARQLAELIASKQFDMIDNELIDKAGMTNVMKSKNIDDIKRLSFTIMNTVGDKLIGSLDVEVSDKDSAQNARKVYMNSGFGIKGLISFIFSSPLLGNAITSAGKIYGIKVAQNITAQYIDARNMMPTIQ